MQWHKFIFSEKRQYKLIRHFVFWITWLLYFFYCEYLYKNILTSSYNLRPFYMTVGEYPVIKLSILLFLYAFGAYGFINFILPVFIKGKWLKGSSLLVLLSTIIIIVAWIVYWNVFPRIDTFSENAKSNISVKKFWPPVYFGLINFIKVLAAASIIKYLKYVWLKEKEKERIEKEKIAAELQLLKAQIHPGFLFTSLDHIYSDSQTGSTRASESLLKLSDLLSYMLYECDQPMVSLSKEIFMMKRYIEMEKIRLGESLEVELNVIGNLKGIKIAPFLLLPFIENSFKQSSSNNPNHWINMDISIDGGSFHMKLSNGMWPGIDGQPEPTINNFDNVQKRLNLLYPEKHELKILSEQEMLIVHLRIQLDEATFQYDKYEKTINRSFA